MFFESGSSSWTYFFEGNLSKNHEGAPIVNIWYVGVRLLQKVLENNTKNIEVASARWFSHLKQKTIPEEELVLQQVPSAEMIFQAILDQKTVFVARITVSFLSWRPRVISENPDTSGHILATSAEVNPKWIMV